MKRAHRAEGTEILSCARSACVVLVSSQQPMSFSASQKGKGRPDDSLDHDDSLEFSSRSSTSSGSSTSSLSSSESESESDHGADSLEDEDEDEISQEYLDSLLEKARASIADKAAKNTPVQNGDALELDVIRLNDTESELECVFFCLHPSLPAYSHLTSGDSLHSTLALCHLPILRSASLRMMRHQPSVTWMSSV